jgi:hypothetical protein
METKKGRGWRLLTIATVVFFVGVGIYLYSITIGESKQIEQTLIERHGWANKYIPPADGVLLPSRLERFIRVREAVQTNCVVFQQILDDVIALEALEADKDMPAGEKASKSLDSFKSMFSIAPGFLEFMDARNQALLAEEMGLGEYIYIYLAAYGEQLADDTNSVYADMEEAHISPRSRKEFAQILLNQANALEATDTGTETAALIGEIRREAEALGSRAQASPWPNGPPERTQESLLPFRKQLNDLYCTGIVKTELMQKNRGLSLEG